MIIKLDIFRFLAIFKEANRLADNISHLDSNIDTYISLFQ